MLLLTTANIDRSAEKDTIFLKTVLYQTWKSFNIKLEPQ